MSDNLPAVATKADVERFKTYEESLAQEIVALKFEREEDLAIAAAYNDTANTEIKRITDYFGPRKKKANDVWKDWVAAEKEACAPFEKMKTYLKQKREELFRTLKAEADAKEAELRKQAEERNIPQESVVVPKVAAPKMRKTYSYSVVDPDLIPREYLMLDTSKVQGIATATKATAQIPGIKFFVKEIAY